MGSCHGNGLACPSGYYKLRINPNSETIVTVKGSYVDASNVIIVRDIYVT